MLLLPSLEIRKTSDRGKGVFATAEIEAGTPVGDYLGKVCPADEGDVEYDGDAVYDMWYSDEVDICPHPDSEGTHLINTSCEPNCGMTALGRHTVIFALRKIYPGEELTYDYFMGDQDEDCEPGTDNCKCGSDLCRGTIYSNPKAYAEWEKYLEELIGDEPEEAPVPFGEQLPPLDSYPESIEDHPIYPLFGCREVEPLKCTSDVLKDTTKMRSLLRKSGRQLLFPEFSIVVEGIMYGGHMVMQNVENATKCKKAEQAVKLVSV